MGSLLNFPALLATVLLIDICETTNSPTDALTFFPHSAEDEARLRQLVDEINEEGKYPWKAEYNPLAAIKARDEGKPPVDYSDLLLEGLSINESRKTQVLQDTVEHLHELASHPITLPSSFDAREKWSGCPSVHQIQDQGGCGSCWAVSSTSMLSDRRCISSNYTQQRMISAHDLITCCEFCGGCGGTSVFMEALLYWKKHGIVSGGAFGSNEGCRPYGIAATCGSPCPAYSCQKKFTPKCERSCESHYGTDYTNDLQKGRKSYYLMISDGYQAIQPIVGPAYERYAETIKELDISPTELIKRELVLHGPVMIGITVAEPFAHYRSGVYTDLRSPRYTPLNSTMTTGHAMLGWGEESGEQYWIVANSFGKHWGEKGFGRISMQYFTQTGSQAAAGLW